MSRAPRVVFNPPPGWPPPPKNWSPPTGWSPDPNWPAPPPGWQLWIAEDEGARATDSAHSERSSGPSTTTEGTNALGRDQRIAFLEAENATLRAKLESGDSDIVVLDDERVLQDVGIYRYHHPLESA